MDSNHSLLSSLGRLLQDLQSLHSPEASTAYEALLDQETELGCITEAIFEGDFEGALGSPTAQLLFGHEDNEETVGIDVSQFEDDYSNYIPARLSALLSQGPSAVRDETSCVLVALGYAALHAFLQANVTGPPLSPSISDLLIPTTAKSGQGREAWQRSLVESLMVDGSAAYALTPHLELFCLAKVIFNEPSLTSGDLTIWRMRVNFLHQRLLTESVSTLQSQIYEDLAILDAKLVGADERLGHASKEARARFLIERATVHIHYGSDASAREDLARAAVATGLKFALTGRLGKRTKFQENQLSQLVVLACSVREDERQNKVEAPNGDSTNPPLDGHNLSHTGSKPPRVRITDTGAKRKPKNLDLNDDTLLESISFAPRSPIAASSGSHSDAGDDSLPVELEELDPAKQPLLKPLDSIILLSIASSITNTSPSDGLTREETVPYAIRVLDGGSSNWQIYTQALLVRSRIEGYRSRTVERGVLQLQALVDQVIAETSGDGKVISGATTTSSASTFLPKANGTESAPVMERLRYIHQLSAPTRWELEAELAARWISLGGLRTALEIYERLQMWAEVSLCWAGLEREDRAKRIIRRQLFHPTARTSTAAVPRTPLLDDDGEPRDTETYEGPPLDPPPVDAPRFYCILGDIEEEASFYIKAWEVSNQRYARAQRSLGKMYFAAGDFAGSVEAYVLSLRINPQNHSTWYALGCARLQINDWDGAIEAFSRAVQLDEEDAESWSNLAAALLERKSTVPRIISASDVDPIDDEDSSSATTYTTQAPRSDYRIDALKALKRAARLQRSSWRIWDNVLTVAGSTSPPSYSDIVIATTRLIELRGPSVGEAAIDIEAVDLLVRHIITTEDIETLATGTDGYDASRPGLARMVVALVDTQVIPLITASHELWRIVARLSLWRRRPSSALSAYEKAWRAVLAKPGWADGGPATESAWKQVVDVTVELVDAYENLGDRERSEGLAAGDGQLVEPKWAFKARSAIRKTMSVAKDAWEGSPGWHRLVGKVGELASG